MPFPYRDLDDHLVLALKNFCKDDCIKAIQILKERIELFDQDDLYLKIEILELPLSIRSYTALREQGFQTVKDVLMFDMNRLCFIRNIGPKAEKEIRDVFEKIEQKKNQLNGLSRDQLREALSSS